MDLEDMFQCAKTQKGIRRKFLEKLIKKHPEVPYVSNVSYSNKQKYSLFSNILISTKKPFLSNLGILRRPSKIIIFPWSFETKIHQNLNDFESTLFDHEYFHAKETFYNPKSILSLKIFQNREYSLSFKRMVSEEFNAFENQITLFEQKECSDIYKKAIFKKYKKISNAHNYINK